jgi:transcriptional regulator with XRE-family HTH domain
MGLPHCLIGLRQIRRARKISVADIAEVIGVASTSYLRFENGTRRIYFDKVVKIAQRLGVRTDDLTILMDEQDALKLLDHRDKAAIAAGTFNLSLSTPGGPLRTPPPPPEPQAVPPPPSEPSDIVVSAPGAIDDLAAELGEWKL